MLLKPVLWTTARHVLFYEGESSRGTLPFSHMALSNFKCYFLICIASDRIQLNYSKLKKKKKKTASHAQSEVTGSFKLTSSLGRLAKQKMRF